MFVRCFGLCGQRDVLGKQIVRLTQALRSALSPSAPPSARRVGCVCVSALVSAMKVAPQLTELAAVVGDKSGHAEMIEALPKLVLSMVACAAGDEDAHPDIKVRTHMQLLPNAFS